MVFSNFFDSVASRETASGNSEDATRSPANDDANQKSSSRKKKKKKKNGPESKTEDPDASAKKTFQSPVKDQQSAAHKNGNDGKQDRKRRRHNSDQRGDNRKFQRRSRPSPEALELSRQLMDLSRRKKMIEALDLYWNETNNHLRDAHHACIVVDCCARCGDISKGRAVLEAIPPDHVTIELQTALIKGYAHCGDMHNAMRVFRDLFSKHKQGQWKDMQVEQRPNVRTLNTLLRGCLWTAANVSHEDEAGANDVAGGVVSSEEAWSLYIQYSADHAPPDTSSYEAAVTLLCQAFRFSEALARIEQFQQQFNIRIKGKASIKAGDADHSVLETLGSVYLSLARAYAMRGDYDELWQAAQRSLRAIESSRKLLSEMSAQGNEAEDSSKKKQDFTRGGKRGWKKDSAERQTEQRNASNVTYRHHRLNEMEAEVKAFIKMRAERGDTNNNPKNDPNEAICNLITSRLFYFGGGGSTELSEQRSVLKKKKERMKSTPEALFLPKWQSFGLAEFSSTTATATHKEKNAVPPKKDVQSHNQWFNSDGQLQTSAIFGDGPARPIDLELGSGFGDWIVRQSDSHGERNHIAVELRADRVYQIFSRVVLNGKRPLQNVCIVGAEAGSFLEDRVLQGSISNIFVNFPEPPTQTYGDDRVELDKVESGELEPAHMLSCATLKAAFYCLRPGGRIIVVTDNRWYAKLVCVTLVRLSRQVKSIRAANSLEMPGFREIENFRNGIKMYEGQPNQEIGHAEESSTNQGGSYFDRLWRTGTSNFAHRTKRFVVVVKRKD